MILSAITLTPLSAVADNIEYFYFNGDRHDSDTYTMKEWEGMYVADYTALDDVIDVSVENNALTFLTNPKHQTFISPEISSNFVYYDDTTSVEVADHKALKNSLLLTSPYRSTLNYNVVPLKSYSLEDHYDYSSVSDDVTIKRYDAIYQQPDASVVLQYKTSVVPVQFKSDTTKTIVLPDNIASYKLSALGFVDNGSWSGDRPANSDLILLDRYDTAHTTNNVNGLPLCHWLSGNTWMERWYDPNNISQGDALLTKVNTTSSINPVIDVVSNTVVGSKNKLTYIRNGEGRNQMFINSMSSNLIFHVNKWNTDISYNTVNGFVIPLNTITEEYSEMPADGSFHYHIPPTNELLDTNDHTISLWINQDWKNGIDTQYFGNFSNDEGFGLFYNTGANSNLLTIPSSNGIIYGFNNRGIKVFEKDLNRDLNTSGINITYITTDIFGVRWLYDSYNKKIYRLDTDDLIKTVIDLPTTANITKMDIDESNNLYVFNGTTSPRISGFDVDGSVVYNSAATTYDTFVFNSAGTLTKDFADHIDVDSANNKFKIIGINLYKNNSIFYHVGQRVSAMRIDTDDNIWILRQNKLLKLDKNGKKVFDMVLPIPSALTDYGQELNFVRKDGKNGETDTVWVVINQLNQIIVLDMSGNITKRINVRDLVNPRLCKDLALQVKGHFSNFDIKKRYNRISNKIISRDNPAITYAVNLRCGDNKRIEQLHVAASSLQGWTNIAVVHQIVDDQTIITLYINGKAVSSKTINGIYFVDYGSKVSPFIIGGHSGKLGARNVERSLSNSGYFVGKLNDLRYYNRPLDPEEIKAVSRTLYWNKWFDLTWFMPTPETTAMEQIRHFHLNRYKGHKSNRYNLRIKGLDITDEPTREIIKNTIKSLLPKITPVNTQLNTIIFD